MIRRPCRRVPAAGVTIAALLLCLTAVLTACGGGSSSTSTAQATSTPPSQSAELEQQFVHAVKAIQPEVTQIRTPTALGSGVVFDGTGDVVTNAHVVAGASEILVTLADGARYPARLLDAYVPDDLAVIKIEAGHSLKPAHFADSSRLEVGDIVLAVGNPLGLKSSVTDGIISALGRNVVEGQGLVLPNVIQTSAPINPGNSGGALVDLLGDVVGIPTLAATNPQLGTTATGIGFAIASNTVTDIAQQIVKYGRVVNSHRASLGAEVTDLVERSGVLVTSVEAGGPAEKAGIRVNDVIEAISGNVLTHANQLATALANLKPGQAVALTVIHSDGSRSTSQVTLGQLSGG